MELTEVDWTWMEDKDGIDDMDAERSIDECDNFLKYLFWISTKMFIKFKIMAQKYHGSYESD